MKIVFLDASTVGDVKNLNQFNELGEYTQFDNTLPEERQNRLKNCDIVISNKVVIDRELMEQLPTLKMICIAATGMNNVDLECAREKGIVVKNVAGYSTESVAQATFSMLFHLLHQNSYYDNYVKNGKYQESPIFTHHVREFWELKGKQFGIIGLGTIGKRVAELALGFGCKVVYFSTSGKNIEGPYPHVSLEQLLKHSDIVSVHCPLNAQTQNLLDLEELRLMQAHAYLLNMGRGGIINEAALAQAIDNNSIAGAGVDVLTQEPIATNNPLLQVKQKHKLFITPHIAWASIESRNLLVEMIQNNIKEFKRKT